METLHPDVAAALAPAAPALPLRPITQADIDWANEKFRDDDRELRVVDAEDYYGTRNYR